MHNHHYVAIMAGGIGSRFWPKSRGRQPKQFLDILNIGKTLLQLTFERFQQFIPKDNILVITSVEYMDMVQAQLPNISRHNILCEPTRKNTAPCIAYVNFRLSEMDPQATVICSPSDHYIKDIKRFQATCEKALKFAEDKQHCFVTVGITPTNPHTGYGYIQYLPEKNNDFCLVKTFTEKPSLDIAKTFLKSGDFLWNAGLFIAHNHFMLQSLKVLSPEMYELFDSHKKLFNTQMEFKALENIYPQCVNTSFDYEIMEKSKHVYVIPADFDWSDLGTWESLYNISTKTEQNNCIKGEKVLLYDVDNSLISISNKEKLVIVQGLEDHIVIDTDNVLLICKKDKDQEIKRYIEEIKKRNWNHYL